MSMQHRADVAIIGSGFAGSLLASILARKGMRIALIDSAQHPRFAIGESSTPIADSILRRLGTIHEMPELESLSAWGSWQRTHPEIACGRKRGFSYFQHFNGQPFSESHLGEQSLMVAASPSDEVADTHWYRADVDTFFWRQAIDSGATDMTRHEVVALTRRERGGFGLQCRGPSATEIIAQWIVDASGQSNVLARLSDSLDQSERLRTRTHACFAHYTGVKSWHEIAVSSQLDQTHDPFDPDDAAQHHLLADGWAWMLRFNNGVTSVGYTAHLDRPLESPEQIACGYPSLHSLMKTAKPVAPGGGPLRSGRLQRWFDPIVDSRQIMLPTAAVTLDPLHSTGIAHALAGVDRVWRIITESDRGVQRDRLDQYRSTLFEETNLLDVLVSTAYDTMHDFERFTTACMLYFAGAIRCEERYQAGDVPSHLWNADDAEFVAFVSWACSKLRTGQSDFKSEIRKRLASWNSAGLMKDDCGNRYAYTATKKNS